MQCECKLIDCTCGSIVMTPQSAFMISAVIRPDRQAHLEQRLDSMNISPGVVDADNALIPFARLKTLHFARFLIVDPRNATDIEAHGVSPHHSPPTLFFIGDCDGPTELFLAELVTQASDGLKEIFSHCERFDQQADSVLDWMLANNVRPSANYVNRVGRSVTQVHEETALHRCLIKHLCDLGTDVKTLSPEALRQRLQNFARSEIAQGRLSLTATTPTPAGWWVTNQLHRFGVPLVLLLISPLLLILLPIFVIRLRMLEKTDPEITPRPDPEHVSRLAEAEDHLVTNQFSAFGDVKPGPFRGYLIAFFLYMLDYASRHVYNRGNLTRVRTIHFARWVLLNNNRHVLFLSNYDGDLESYMDDFINKVGWGLNLVFSNGVGWPETRWLIKGGAEHEQRFKHYLRRHQYATAVWYKAYPDLTAVELERNTLIREGLFRRSFSTDQALQRWFGLI